MRWRVHSPEPRSWTVTGPNGRQWTGLPSLAAAVNLAHSLADIDSMLTQINRSKLAVVPDPAKPPQRCARKHYGFHRVAL